MWKDILTYINSLSDESPLLQKVLQGDLWKKKSFGSKLVLPIIIYYDDNEPNNILGNHRGLSKIGAVYSHIPCLPPHLQSKLENIFVTLLCNPLDEKEFGFSIILSPVINELKHLESKGIKIFEGTCSEITVYFSILSVIGDNLGINGIHSFITCFSGNYCCRFCLTNKNDMKNTIDENACLLRTDESYKQHLEPKDFESFGIKSPSCISILPNFNVMETLCTGSMHDILEGVCQYDLGKVLRVYIYKKKIF